LDSPDPVVLYSGTAEDCGFDIPEQYLGGDEELTVSGSSYSFNGCQFVEVTYEYRKELVGILTNYCSATITYNYNVVNCGGRIAAQLREVVLVDFSLNYAPEEPPGSPGGWCDCTSGGKTAYGIPKKASDFGVGAPVVDVSCNPLP
jgi:hypothetical protein